jgi:hypothetical protein
VLGRMANVSAASQALGSTSLERAEQGCASDESGRSSPAHQRVEGQEEGQEDEGVGNVTGFGR